MDSAIGAHSFEGMPNAPYEDLLDRLRRKYVLGTVGDLLGWDEQVNLRPGSVKQREAQLELLAELQHGAETAPELGRLIDELEGGPQSPEAACVVREARRDYDRARKLPVAFIRERASLGSRAYHAWVEARRENDFPAFQPFLERQLEFAKKEAVYLGREAAPYDHFIDAHDPGLTAEWITPLFAELQEGLVPLVRRIEASPIRPRKDFQNGFPVDRQERFLREVTTRMGFDYDRGRLDVSVHPFCSGTGSDTRMTTRFDPDQPFSALFGSIHETGHGLYEQGLPAEFAGTALGRAAGMAVHESQSRLWENQVGRGRAFWSFFAPRLRKLFPKRLRDVSDDELHLAINAVKPTLIRVEADEVTYNLHIILRFELERRLFAGELAVRDLPDAWREAAGRLLGREPASDAEGVLQDVHWSGGAFGYFPSYCLGSMLAAQLWDAAREALPGLEDDFARGDFSRLLGWLRREVHARGRRHTLPELTRLVTGAELSPQPLLRYLRERYGPIYGVGVAANA